MENLKLAKKLAELSDILDSDKKIIIIVLPDKGERIACITNELDKTRLSNVLNTVRATIEVHHKKENN